MVESRPDLESSGFQIPFKNWKPDHLKTDKKLGLTMQKPDVASGFIMVATVQNPIFLNPDFLIISAYTGSDFGSLL